MILRESGVRPTMDEEVPSMPPPPSTQEVEDMVRTKLRHQYPNLYRELLASGELDEVAQARARVFDEIFEEVSGNATFKALFVKLGLSGVRDRALPGEGQRTEQALAAALEFPEDEENSHAV